MRSLWLAFVDKSAYATNSHDILLPFANCTWAPPHQGPAFISLASQFMHPTRAHDPLWIQPLFRCQMMEALAWRIFRKIAGKFLSEFSCKKHLANVLALFFQVSGLPKEFTPKIHAKNRRHSSPISLSRTQVCSHRFSAYGGDKDSLSLSLHLKKAQTSVQISKSVPFTNLYKTHTLYRSSQIITGSLVTLENLFPQNSRYRYRLEIRMNSFNYHYSYRLGVRSHPFISIDSQLPSWKSFELFSPKLPLPLPSWHVFESER